MSGLNLDHLHADPIAQFNQWFAEAKHLPMPEAMTLATVDADGAPRARMVLLKKVDNQGFYFFTNYQSPKGSELQHHPAASLLFWWEPLRRQIRIEGPCTKADTLISDDYFASRPRNSQLGAWSSPQSQVIEDRAELEHRFAEQETRFHDQDVPRPPHWGGFLVVPHRMEFWQERPFRLHDRFVYERRAGQQWHTCRLAP